MTRIIPTGQRQDDRCGQRVRGGEDRGTEDGTERQQGQRQGSHCRQCRRQGGDPHGSRRRDGKQRRQQGQERDGGSLDSTLIFGSALWLELWRFLKIRNCELENDTYSTPIPVPISDKLLKTVEEPESRFFRIRNLHSSSYDVSETLTSV